MREPIVGRKRSDREAEGAIAVVEPIGLPANEHALPGAEDPSDVDEFTDLGTWHRLGVRAGAGVTLS